MEPRIELLPQTNLVGQRVKMSFTNNKISVLWQGFMPKRATIRNVVGTELYSLEVYDNPDFFSNFNPNNEFEKWAAVKVSNFDSVPEDMETLILPKGLYAVFMYKGKASEAPSFYQHIYGQWIPNSDYILDHRPHFAVMGEKYKYEDPNSEEEIWIPVKKR